MTDAPATSPAPPTLRRRLLRLVRVLLIAYLLGAVVLYLVQDKMTFPAAALQGTPATHVTPGPGESLVMLSAADGHPIAALWGPALTPNGQPRDDAPDRLTVLYFYGNGESITYVDWLFQALRRTGVNVLVPDYVGYGMSSGKPSARGVYQTADAAFAHLTVDRGLPPSRIVLLGQSIGAAPAVDLASRHPVAGLVTVSAFRSLADIAQRVAPIYPARLLLRHPMDNLARMPLVRAPALIIHGTADELIPHDSAAALARAAGGPATVVDVPDATHNDIFDIGGDALLRRISEFLAAVSHPAAADPKATAPQSPRAPNAAP